MVGISFSAFAEQKEIVVGLASNFSEVSSSSSNPFSGSFKNGVTFAIENAKAKLQKKGVNLKTLEFDYGNSDSRVLEVAKKAVASSAVAVVGYNFSSHALLAAPIHQQAGLAFVTPSATANRIGSLGPFVHQACFDNAFMGETLAKIALTKLKAKKAAVVAAADCAYCTDLAQAFETEFKKGGGVISVNAPILQSDTEFGSVYEKLKDQSYDVILVPNQELLSARVISTLSGKGILKPFLGGDGWGNVGEEFFGILNGKQLTGYSVSHWHPEEKSAMSRKFSAGYTKKFGKSPDDTSVLSYDAMSLLIEAILQTKDYSRAGIEKSLNSLKQFYGVTGKFIFQNKRAPKKSLVLLSANNSKFKVLERVEPLKGGGK
jgi:branched-chain amino acid transport system substrate-binding protein